MKQDALRDASNKLMSALRAIGTIAERKPGQNFIRVTHLKSDVIIDTNLLTTLAQAICDKWTASVSAPKPIPDGSGMYPRALFISAPDEISDNDFLAFCEESQSE